jgi:hypothetical protein
VEFGEAVDERVVPEQEGEQDDVPQAFDGVVVAAVSTGLDEASDELLVGDGVEGIANGGQRGTIFEFAPSEEGLGSVDQHSRPPGKGRPEYTKRQIPRSGQ